MTTGWRTHNGLQPIQRACERIAAQNAHQDIHVERGEEECERGEVAERLGDGQDVEQQAEWVESRLLSGGQERHTGEDVGIP